MNVYLFVVFFSMVSDPSAMNARMEGPYETKALCAKAQGMINLPPRTNMLHVTPCFAVPKPPVKEKT